MRMRAASILLFSVFGTSALHPGSNQWSVPRRRLRIAAVTMSDGPEPFSPEWQYAFLAEVNRPMINIEWDVVNVGGDLVRTVRSVEVTPGGYVIILVSTILLAISRLQRERQGWLPKEPAEAKLTVDESRQRDELEKIMPQAVPPRDASGENDE